VNWIWAGGWVLAIGAVICMVPRIETLFQTEAQPVQVAEQRPLAISQPAANNGRKSRNGRPVVAAR